MSGSDSNVEVKITANVSDLKAQLAEAQANVRAFSGAIDQLAQGAARQNITNAVVPPQLKTELDQAKQKVADLTVEIQKIEAPAKAAAESVATIAPAAGEAAAGVETIAPAAEHARVPRLRPHQLRGNTSGFGTGESAVRRGALLGRDHADAV